MANAGTNIRKAFMNATPGEGNKAGKEARSVGQVHCSGLLVSIAGQNRARFSNAPGKTELPTQAAYLALVSLIRMTLPVKSLLTESRLCLRFIGGLVGGEGLPRNCGQIQGRRLDNE